NLLPDLREYRFESGRGHHSRLLQVGFSNHPTAAPARRVARLCQRDHAAPELLALAGVNVVFAHEREPAVAGEAIDHDPGGQRLDCVAVADREWPNARRHQKSPARVDAEGSQMDTVALDCLDEARLAGLRIDREHRNVVLAAVEDLLAFEVDLALVAVGEIDETAVG